MIVREGRRPRSRLRVYSCASFVIVGARREDVCPSIPLGSYDAMWLSHSLMEIHFAEETSGPQ
jgi:hypothetical protein